MSEWGPIYGSRCLTVSDSLVDLTDVTLVDEDINLILADDTKLKKKSCKKVGEKLEKVGKS